MEQDATAGVEPVEVKLPPLELRADLRARNERLLIRRGRVKAKLAVARRGVRGSDDDDLPDADLRAEEEAQAQAEAQAQGKGKAKGKKKELKPPPKPCKVDIEPTLNIEGKLTAHIEKSTNLLEQLLLDAETYVTNVKVAAEFRERERHDEQEEDKRSRLEKLREEAEESERMYEKIADNWFTEAKGVLPLELYEKIRLQKLDCEELLEKKQDLIDTLKSDIEGFDVQYESDLKKYQKDLILMGDRIDEQVELLRIAFMTELEIVEQCTIKDRETLMEENEKEYAVTLAQYDELSEATVSMMHDACLKRFSDLADLFTSSREEARRMKCALENDLQTLQMEMEEIKIAIILNAEKLEYNLEILRRREKENMKMKSSMKRLLIHLQDRFNAKLKHLRDMIKAAHDENRRLIKEIRRLQGINQDATRKALLTVNATYQKYMGLWKMNEDEARDKLTRLIEIEKFILENYMNLEVNEASLSALDDRPDEVQFYIRKLMDTATASCKMTPLKEEEDQRLWSQSDSYRTGSRSSGTDFESNPENANLPSTPENAVKSKMSNSTLIIEPTDSNEFLPGPSPDPEVQRRLMKHIAKVICDQTGFIIEEKLRKIIAPMIRTEKTLIHIDAVLHALGVTNFDQMQVLARYLLRESRVMRGIMSKMETAVTPDISEMRLSDAGDPTRDQEATEALMVNLLNQIGQARKPKLDIEGEVLPKNLLISASSSDMSSVYGDDVPGSAEGLLGKAAKEGGINYVSDFQFGKTPKRQVHHGLQEDLSSGVLTPVSQVSSPSLGGIIEDFTTDESLVNVLKQIQEAQIDEAEEEGETGYIPIDSPITDSTCNSSSICSCESVQGELPIRDRESSLRTTDATVLSWMRADDVDTEMRLLYPHGYEEYDCEDGGEGFPCVRVLQAKPEEGDPEVYQEEEEVKPRELSDQESGACSHTVSILSLAPSSAGSEEFLYIEPNDVLRALAAFCKDFNASHKIEIQTEAEIIEAKLAKLRFPNNSSVVEYWNRFLLLLDPRSGEIWDAILKCFGYYAEVLKARNKLILDIERLCKENRELSFLMKRNYKGHCTGSNFEPVGDPSSLPYCECD